MSFVAVAVAGASLIGGVAAGAMQSGAASKAAAMQLQASREANELQKSIWNDQKSMYQQQRKDIAPWRKAGVGALSQLGNADFQRDFTMADFQADPGYAFRMQEGQKAIERSAAARGGLQTGGTLKALTRFGQDFASNEYQNAYNRFNADRDRRFNRLASIAGVGQTANSQLGQAGAQLGAAGQNYAGQMGSNLMGAANAAGAAGIAGANAWGNTLSGIGKIGMDAYAMNQQNNWMNQWLQNRG